MGWGRLQRIAVTAARRKRHLPSMREYFRPWKLISFGALVMRSANFGASLALYGICGAIWIYRGDFDGFLAALRRRVKGETAS
jgi:hypothetical protein